MTRMLEAGRGIASGEVKAVAGAERVPVEFVRRGVAAGRIVVLRKGESVLGIGAGLRAKVNANIGTSPDYDKPEEEMAKLRAAAGAGADTVMDLSVGRDPCAMLARVLKESPVPVGSVPVYSAFIGAMREKRRLSDVSGDEMIGSVARHLEMGASFVTVHAAITRRGVELARRRVLKVVSRGGCFLSSWMIQNGLENPLYENFGYILELAKEHDAAISIGDALRPGAISDSGDAAMLHELKLQGRLTRMGFSEGVGIICEGPGHMPIGRIAENVRLQKRVCSGAPYYVLGPLVTDVAAGYDHVAGAIGGAVAAAAGADFLCVVTPSEHLALPTAEDVVEGVVASRIAAHAADIARRGRSGPDLEMSRARWRLDWEKQLELSLNRERAAGFRERRATRSGACSMCGEFCAYGIARRAMGR